MKIVLILMAMSLLTILNCLKTVHYATITTTSCPIPRFISFINGIPLARKEKGSHHLLPFG